MNKGGATTISQRSKRERDLGDKDHGVVLERETTDSYSNADNNAAGATKTRGAHKAVQAVPVSSNATAQAEVSATTGAHTFSVKSHGGGGNHPGTTAQTSQKAKTFVQQMAEQSILHLRTHQGESLSFDEVRLALLYMLTLYNEGLQRFDGDPRHFQLNTEVIQRASDTLHLSHQTIKGMMDLWEQRVLFGRLREEHIAGGDNQIVAGPTVLMTPMDTSIESSTVLTSTSHVSGHSPATPAGLSSSQTEVKLNTLLGAERAIPLASETPVVTEEEIVRVIDAILDTHHYARLHAHGLLPQHVVPDHLQFLPVTNYFVTLRHLNMMEALYWNNFELDQPTFRTDFMNICANPSQFVHLLPSTDQATPPPPLFLSEETMERILPTMGFFYGKGEALVYNEDEKLKRAERIRSFIIEYADAMRDPNAVVCFVDECFFLIDDDPLPGWCPASHAAKQDMLKNASEKISRLHLQQLHHHYHPHVAGNISSSSIRTVTAGEVEDQEGTQHKRPRHGTGEEYSVQQNYPPEEQRYEHPPSSAAAYMTDPQSIIGRKGHLVMALHAFTANGPVHTTTSHPYTYAYAHAPPTCEDIDVIDLGRAQEHHAFKSLHAKIRGKFATWVTNHFIPTFQKLYPTKHAIMVLDNALYHHFSETDRAYDRERSFTRNRLIAEILRIDPKPMIVNRSPVVASKSRSRGATSMKFDLRKLDAMPMLPRYPEGPSRDELLAHLRSIRPHSPESSVGHVLEKLLAQRGWRVVFTPPYVAQPQPAELIWGHCENVVKQCIYSFAVREFNTVIPSTTSEAESTTLEELKSTHGQRYRFSGERIKEMIREILYADLQLTVLEPPSATEPGTTSTVATGVTESVESYTSTVPNVITTCMPPFFKSQMLHRVKIDYSKLVEMFHMEMQRWAEHDYKETGLLVTKGKLHDIRPVGTAALPKPPRPLSFDQAVEMDIDDERRICDARTFALYDEIDYHLYRVACSAVVATNEAVFQAPVPAPAASLATTSLGSSKSDITEATEATHASTALISTGQNIGTGQPTSLIAQPIAMLAPPPEITPQGIEQKQAEANVGAVTAKIEHGQLPAVELSMASAKGQ